MAGLFWRQFGILFWKNWIVLSKHPVLNLVRCFILPVAYGIFLATAQLFLIKPNNNGLGTAVPIPTLRDTYDASLAFVWADGTNGTNSPTPEEIMARVTAGFSDKQLGSVKKAASVADIPKLCPQNFNLFSECFVAIAFNDIPEGLNDPVNYTIRADAGLFHIDVERHTSDFEQRILPLQWAVDEAIIQLRTGIQTPVPMEWPFTQATNEEQSRDIRLSYIRGLRTLLVLALFICFVGIAYQLPGSVASERAEMLTAHLKAMGLMDSARILSWHVSISLAYLPAWIIVGLIWHYRIFTASNAGLILVVHLLLGVSLASWSFFVAAPFGKSPQLAAVVTTFLSILLAILALVFGRASSGAAFVFSVVFPPGYYIFAIRAICGFENHLRPANLLEPDPDNQLRLLPLIIAAIIDVFIWPYFAVLLERRLYDPREPTNSWRFWRRRARGPVEPPAEGIAISIKNLQKTFSTSMFGKGNTVTAIKDLSFAVPKYGIYVLLGSNGAGKSTALSVIGGLAGRTGGSVTFEGALARPPRGTLGIVPQKNVLFPELTCLQTLRVWRAVKRSDGAPKDEDLEQLLRDCDLESKMHARSVAMSGGQKRKLQLAIGLVGGSKVLLVDECTSGVDPLSRRALWKTLTSVRNERTVIFTTHFLDEADLLADRIAILAAPGKLVAEGTPVALKRELGEGYSVQVHFSASLPAEKLQASCAELLDRVRSIAAATYLTTSSPFLVCFHLKTRDPAAVEQVLRLLEEEKQVSGIASYEVLGTSVEDIFLDLMARHDDHPGMAEKASLSSSSSPGKPNTQGLELAPGRSVSPLHQAFTIFRKRALVARRSWLSPLLAVLIAIAGSTIPLVFITNREQTCTVRFRNSTNIALFLPESSLIPFGFGNGSRVVVSPPAIVSGLGNATRFLRVNDVADNASFVATIEQSYRNLSLGGVSLDVESSNSLVAWEASSPGLMGPAMLNLASNILYNRALNSSGNSAGTPNIIQASYEAFPAINAGTLVALKWVAFFGAAMAVYPAFFSLYVCRERRSAVQAMQFSNGLSNPVGLWIGHLLFDSICGVIIATVVVIVFVAASNQFHGLGLLWLVLVLYGIVGALFAYSVALFMPSPLAAFAAVAGYQIIMFILYLAGYLLTLTYAKNSEAGRIITIIHFTLSILSPVASVMRAALVSVNLFSLLCDGSSPVTTASMGVITRFGGPILYLIVYGFVLLGVLVWVDSGSIFSRHSRRAHSSVAPNSDPTKLDVAQEAHAALNSQDILRVQHMSKSFGSNKVVDDVSFGVSRDVIFALLGPNGAGKTTTFNVIRGDVIPDSGDVLINGISVVDSPQLARLNIGVCPQFTAIDSQLTVQEHLLTYGRLKGLGKQELQVTIDSLLGATGLDVYSDRLASKLSGGNQRKLSLAIAMMGNPSVILIDEFSTGVDAKMKRDMWGTLRNVARGKAVIITTHSMEEASALASKVGIIAKRMLAVDTTSALSARYALYEVHFSCHSREDVLKAQQVMAHIPGSRLAEDVATRFEVPIAKENGLSLPDLFHTLSSNSDFSEYTVEKATLESVFLKVIRANNIAEDDQMHSTKRFWCC
ncbi:hypothetical protein PC9H_003010 [Pleurotus ostreatus]|uniref:ABC transporter domain-containing protein n=1 Tax=Pleurotus ostreatus TaxID=5322 RepID=A0A8H7A0M5_PLEOS|nr:uncharacterized protein PC9H_003010 [Pleurotus ostreatus]KAF7436184.1 hypothetical protein PC9H_003010 [Pleurotus ostreatus]KAJ8701830.1 hypothetical protein PTI98_000581 [Pleurotus ostreatus]